MLNKVVLLQRIVQPKTNEYYIENIIEVVRRNYGIDELAIKGSSHKREYSDARSIAMYLIRQYIPGMPLKTLGGIFGGRDHSTVIYSINKFYDLNDTDSFFRRRYENILYILNQRFNPTKAA